MVAVTENGAEKINEEIERYNTNYKLIGSQKRIQKIEFFRYTDGYLKAEITLGFFMLIAKKIVHQIAYIEGVE